MSDHSSGKNRGNSRRTFLKAVGVSIGTMSVEVTNTAAQERTAKDTTDTSSWTTARSNSKRTGAINENGPNPFATTSWKMDLDGSMFSKEPVVANGFVYLPVTTDDTSSESEGYIGAYDIETGDQVWKESDLPSPKTPAISDEMLYFATNISEADEENRGGFYALDIENGETRWSRTNFLKWTSPIVTVDRIYTSNREGAYALNSMTGETIWKTDGVGMLSDGSDGALSYHDGTLFFSDGTALNADDGSVKWKITDQETAFNNHVIDNGRVYYLRTEYIEGDDDIVTVEARAADSGRVEWSYSPETGRVLDRRFAVANGHVLLYDSNEGNVLTALDAETGARIWRKELDGEFFSNLTVANDTIYVGGRYMLPSKPGIGRAAVYALDLTTGNREWTYLLDPSNLIMNPEGPPAAGTPVVAAGKIYTSTYPAGSLLNHQYIQYSNFFVLESSTTRPSSDMRI